MKIDLKDWELFSARRNSNNYISKDGKWLLKASSQRREFDIKELERERNISLAAHKMGIKTPTVGDIVEMPDGGCGLIYEYMANKISYARAISEEPDRLDELMHSFADEAKAFHSTIADTSLVPPFIDLLAKALANTELYTQEEKQIIIDKASGLPQADTCLHGDLQASNIIESDGKAYFIDLEMISYGNPLYDIGFMWFVAETSDEDLAQKVFHVDLAIVRREWETFAQYYFNTDDMDAVIEKVKPFGYVSANLMLLPMPTSGFIKYNKETILDSCRK